MAMPDKMTDADLREWLRVHGPEIERKPIIKKVPNPDALPGNLDASEAKTIDKQVGVTITAADKAEITLERIPEKDRGPVPRELSESGVPITTDDRPVYAVLGYNNTPTASTDNRSPEKKADDAQLDAERRRNSNPIQTPEDPRWETDEERAKRGQATIKTQGDLEQRDIERARQKASDERQAENDRETRARNAEATARAGRSEDRADRNEARGISAQEASNEISRGNLTIAQARDAREQRAADRPKLEKNPTDTDKSLLVQDAEGNFTSQVNPLYDEAKAQATALKEKLALAIQAGQYTRQQADAEYKQWFDTQVTLPFKQMEEARARATEARLAQEADDRRRQFAATYELQRQSQAQNIGQDAAKNELAQLPYRVGPTFGNSFAQGLNALSQRDYSQTPTFQASDFTYQAPDISAIAQRATAAALKSISPYAASKAGYATADYGGIPQPAAAPPPAPGGGYNYASAISGLMGQYLGPTGQPAPAPAPPPVEGVAAAAPVEAAPVPEAGPGEWPPPEEQPQ